MNEGIDRFAYHMPTDEQRERMQRLRSAYRDLFETLTDLCEHNRERSLAITYLEESATRANKAVVFEGETLR